LYEEEIKERLGIPPHVHAAAMIPIGYPKGRFGPLTRRPPEELTHWDRWGVRKPRPH
jgi:nitroreductase